MDQSYLTAVRRRPWVMILTVQTAIAAAILILAVMPTSYSATATAHVGIGVRSRDASYDLVYADRLINTYSKILTSRPVLDDMRARVARETGQTMQDKPDISIRTPANTELVSIMVADQNRQFAAAAANALVSIMLTDVPPWVAAQSPPSRVEGKIVDSADAASAVRHPSKKLVFGGAVLLGLGAGLALVALMNRKDTTLYTDEEAAAATGLPLMGHLDRRSAPTALVSEAVLLRAGLELARDAPARVLVAADIDVDVSAVAVGLARAVAQADRETLLVDADPDLPTLHRWFDLPNEVGLTTLIDSDANVAELVRKTDVPGLSLLPAGPERSEAGNLFSSPQWRAALDEAGSRAAVVVLRSHSVLDGPQASLIGNNVGLAVLVVVCGRSTRESALQAARHLEALVPRVAGVLTVAGKVLAPPPTGSAAAASAQRELS